MKAIAWLLLLPAAVGYAQTESPPAATPAPAAASAPADKTVDKTASPELVGELVKELGVTPSQAEGAAGTLFGVAKSRLGAADFAKVAAAVPNMEGLLKAAPAADAKASALGALAGTSGLGGMAAAAGTMSKLGLKPETIVKLAPTLVKVVQSKGGAEVAKLLTGALK